MLVFTGYTMNPIASKIYEIDNFFPHEFTVVINMITRFYMHVYKSMHVIPTMHIVVL